VSANPESLCNMGGEAPHTPELCSAAAAAIARVGSLADCTLVAEDGSGYKVSKAIVALHSSVFGCASCTSHDCSEQWSIEHYVCACRRVCVGGANDDDAATVRVHVFVRAASQHQLIEFRLKSVTRCPVLMPSAACCCCRDMFHDINDPANSCIKLIDSPARVACLVNHICGGDEYIIDSDNMLDCSCIAEKYDMPRLQRAVTAFAQQLKLTADTVPRYIAIAHEHPGLAELKELCIEYTAKRLQHILVARSVGRCCKCMSATSVSMYRSATMQ
jgi:hypothetical protein